MNSFIIANIKKSKKDSFIQERAYVTDLVVMDLPKKEEKEDSSRGVVIIDILNS